MTFDAAGDLLNRFEALQDSCDLDLLVFFHKHPRTLMTSDQLATLLGYDIKRMAQSLDVLLDTGIVRRSPSSAHAARMYEFAGSMTGGWLSALVRMASTRDGRLALIRSLKSRSRNRPRAMASHADASAAPRSSTGLALVARDALRRADREDGRS